MLILVGWLLMVIGVILFILDFADVAETIGMHPAFEKLGLLGLAIGVAGILVLRSQGIDLADPLPNERQ